MHDSLKDPMPDPIRPTRDASVYSPMEESMKLDHMKTNDVDAVVGHMMSPSDPDNPQNWPLHRKLYVSAVGFAFAFVVLVVLHFLLY